MLLRCQGAAGFFPTAERLYAEQPILTDRLQSLPEERVGQISALGPKDRLTALVAATGTASYFGGMAPARIRACLADDRGLKSLLAGTEQAGKAGVTGTPSFSVNGKLVGTLDWARLEPLLKSAGG